MHYEQDAVIQKIDFYQANQDKFNVLFIGTSRIYRQVAPRLFDSLNNGATTSYNAAYDNLRPYRSFDYINYLEIDSACRYVFIELVPPSRIGGNYNASPAILSINYSRYLSIGNFCLKSNYPLRFKLYYLLRYSQNFFYKYYGFGLKKYLSLILDDDEPERELFPYSLEETRGFMPYDEDPASQENEVVIGRRNNFLKNPQSILNTIIRQSTPVVSEKAAVKDAFIEDLIQVEKALLAEGKKVFYLITPRRKPYDLAYIATMSAFVTSPVIDLSSPALYPAFYLEEYSFNEEHLNKEGAQIFTSALSNAFRNLPERP